MMYKLLIAFAVLICGVCLYAILDYRRTRRIIEMKIQHIKLKRKISEYEILLQKRGKIFPLLAKLYSDYELYKTNNYILEFDSRYSTRSVDKLKETAKELKREKRENKLLKYHLNYLEKLFPWLDDFREFDFEATAALSLIKDEQVRDDDWKNWLTVNEFNKLPDSEKGQLVLDRYINSKKSKLAIGREYERYIGFRYENNGWDVNFHGIIEGYEDLGRDIIAIHGPSVHIVQCKCWSKHKKIHEKHVYQLYGTCIDYALSNNIPLKTISLKDSNMGAFLITSTALSEKAKQVAELLGVYYSENYCIKDYPRVKCNISTSKKEKIYHLPVDQQYDRVKIIPSKGEIYTRTVREAEELGFRRAKKWFGTSASGGTSATQ